MFILRLNLVLTYGIPPEFRGGVHLFIYETAIRHRACPEFIGSRNNIADRVWGVWHCAGVYLDRSASPKQLHISVTVGVANPSHVLGEESCEGQSKGRPDKLPALLFDFQQRTTELRGISWGRLWLILWLGVVWIKVLPKETLSAIKWRLSSPGSTMLYYRYRTSCLLYQWGVWESTFNGQWGYLNWQNP